MKPLLVAPLTQDDVNIWLRIESRYGPGTRYHGLTHADRRDAALMLWARLQNGAPACPIASARLFDPGSGELIDIRGDQL